MKATTTILLSSLILLTLLTSIILSSNLPTNTEAKFSPGEDSKQIYKFSPTQDKLPILLIMSVFVLGIVALTILKKTPKQI